VRATAWYAPALVRSKRSASKVLVPLYRAFNRIRNGSRTVGAVVILVTADGFILLVRNSYESGWGLPGGFLHRRESIHACAARELREETGIKLELDHLESRAVIEKRSKNVTFVFTCMTRSRQESSIKRPTGLLRRSEILGIEWFPLSHMPKLKRGTRELLVAAGFHQYSITEVQ